MRTRVFTSPADVGIGGADVFERAASEAIGERGAFHVALSGGSTPKFMYEALRARQVDWERVHVYFSDERCVPPDSNDSNFKLAHDELLEHVPIPDAQVHRMEGEREPEEAARRYEDVLPERLDLVFLGMGDDGHTASLFPGTTALTAGGRTTANFVGKLGVWRLTFTFGEINSAREKVLLVAGASKAGVLREVYEGKRIYPVEDVDAPLWLLDEAASASLNRTA
ncbi:6-phosphogluconolactonase [Deinococcus yavapaiensis]|uniref:6-phosphogluconolactonase n=1 Tax=Deinococcus yavapaiensis KR-236 TaxID=694435 RepID=A0A318SSN8_9DEIO|nr:6-phosphogluconolactonase [Deinococcus yavapaiensis]PYE56226.1 6-phosphogluconolactonase [Deinococcus yavapaiensis KR-236]